MATAILAAQDELILDEATDSSSESEDDNSQRSASPAPSDSDDDLDYEARRAKQIAENAALMQALGLTGITLELEKKHLSQKTPTIVQKNNTQKKDYSASRPRLRTVNYGTTELPLAGCKQVVSAVVVPVAARRTRRATYMAIYNERRLQRRSSTIYIPSNIDQGSSDSEWELNYKGTKRRRRSNLGYRKVGTKIYDSVNGTTCHQCRQKTICPKIHCNGIFHNGAECSYMLCRTCLEVRYGESFSHHRGWMCPKCRGVCNCSICLKKIGAPRCSMTLNQLQDLGFESVHDMLEHQGFWKNRTTARSEAPHKARKRKKDDDPDDESLSKDTSTNLRRTKSMSELNQTDSQRVSRKRDRYPSTDDTLNEGHEEQLQRMTARSRSGKARRQVEHRKPRRQSAPERLNGNYATEELDSESEDNNNTLNALPAQSDVIEVMLPVEGDDAVNDDESNDEDEVITKKIREAERLHELLSSTMSEIAEIKRSKSVSPKTKKRKKSSKRTKSEEFKQGRLGLDCVSSDSGIGSDEADIGSSSDFLSRAIRDPEAEELKQRIRDVQYLQASGELEDPLLLQRKTEVETAAADDDVAMVNSELRFEDLFQV